MQEYTCVPEELKKLPQWVARREKIPYTPHTGTPAKAGVLETWGTFEDAVKAQLIRGYDGIGFEFAEGGGIVGIDLDHCIDPQKGIIADWANKIIDRMDSYTEVSPSGSGVHIFVRGDIPVNGRKKVIDKATGAAVEMYKAKRYFTVTGAAIKSAPISDRTEELKALYAELFPERQKQQTAPQNTPEYLQIGLERDKTLQALWNGERRTEDESGNDLALFNKLAYWCNRDEQQMINAFLSSPHASQKDGAHTKKIGREDYLHRTAQAAIGSCNRTAAEDNAGAKTEPCARSENTLPGNVPNFYDGNRFLHNVMGDYLTKKYGVCKINGTIHIYDNGLYKQGEEALHGFMIDLIPTLTDTKRKEVYKYIKVSRKTPVKEVSPPHLLPFASRIYDIRENKFIEYAPEHVFLNRFPFDYNPDAPECDTVTQTISSIAEGDTEVVNLLYEAMGNCFYMLNSFRGAVMLYGKSGNNGKSTLLNMIATMIGRENASYLTLQDTAERFRLTEIYGKAANIGDDIPSSYLPESSTFKKLVTGERITAEKKGQDPFSFKPYAKMFFAMNGLPPVSDKTRAFFGRILLIPLNNDFSKSAKMDVNLKDKQWSRQEMECLTKYAVEGLKRLLQNGDFTRPQCVLDAVAEYEAENNPVKEFLDEYGMVANQTTEFVYDRFTEWCYRSGHRNIMTRKKFTREACEQTGLKSGPIRIGDKIYRGFVTK